MSSRNGAAESASRGTGSGSLPLPHSTASSEDDNASAAAVNESSTGPQQGPLTRDFAVRGDQPAPPTVIEPPTSSVDAPKDGSNSKQSSSPSMPGRSRSSSAPSAPLSSPSQPRRPSIGLRQPSIGIRRIPSSGALRQATLDPDASANALQQVPSRLAAVEEEVRLAPVSTTSTASTESSAPQAGPSRLKRASSALQTRFSFRKDKERDVEANRAPTAAAEAPLQYTSNMVDVLDTVDPEVQTLTSLTNIQNSLFVPNLGRFVNRRPTYTIQRPPSETQSLEEINRILAPARETEADNGLGLTRSETEATLATLATINSRMSDSRYAVLPHGTTLEGWTKEEKQELNDHVRHMMHSRRSKFKRAMRGFGQYVRRPLGFLVTVYATLITLFGLAWVLFLIGWINVGGRQLYIINVIDNILVALFAIVGDGLAPFRAVDTYHMIFIAHYHYYTWSRRKKDMLPKLRDHNDLPSRNAPINGRSDSDPEDVEKQDEFTVLAPKQQAKLEHHQAKFSKSHSFYKPHETDTHHAFPLRLLVAIVVLLDCHSLLQISLGACTWGIYYKVRPFALTTVILCCSITCNATAGLLIMIGDRRTRKKDVLERMNRQELTEEAMHHLARKKERESESEREGADESSKKEGRRSLNFIRHTQSHGSGKGKGKEKGKEVGKGKEEEMVKELENAYPIAAV